MRGINRSNREKLVRHHFMLPQIPDELVRESNRELHVISIAFENEIWFGCEDKKTG